MMLMLVDHEGRVTAASADAQDFLGVTPLALAGLSLPNQLSVAARATWTGRVAPAIAAGRALGPLRLTFVIANRERETVLTLVPATAAPGELAVAFATLAEGLPETASDPEPFGGARDGRGPIRTLVHELNNLITCILGSVAIADRAAPGDARAHASLVAIEEAAERAASVGRNLLAATRSPGHPAEQPPLTLCAAEPVSAASVRSQPVSSTASVGGESLILVAEGHPDVRDLVVAHLASTGHRVIATADAESTVCAIAANGADLGLLVISADLPGGSGIQCARDLRSRHADIAVIITSGAGTELPLDLQSDRVALVWKPYRLVDLAAAADRMLRRLAD